jgi:hypothetical protein
LILHPHARVKTGKVPARILAVLEKAAAVAFMVRRAKRALSRKRVTVIAAIIELYRTVRRERADHYVSSSVRLRGIWRDWPDACCSAAAPG